MKKIIGLDLGAYTFDPQVKKIGFTGVGSLTLDQILLITNSVTGNIIYNFADPTAGGTLNNNVLTLEYDTTSMSATDPLSIIINYGDGLEEENEIKSTAIQGADGIPFPQGENGVMQVEDLSIDNIFGTTPLYSKDTGRLMTEMQNRDVFLSKPIAGANSEFSVDCIGFSSCAIQISGTWAGTQTFEASIDGGTWGNIFGQPNSGVAPVSTTTASGIWRFSIAATARIRVRFSTYTSGTAIIGIRLSSSPIVPQIVSGATTPVSGSQSTLNQRATTFEANTYDTNLATILGTSVLVNPQAEPAKVAPVAPTIPASYVANFLGMQPQRLPMVRVQAAGSERVPFTQQPNTYELNVVAVQTNQLLEKILFQLMIQNQMYMNTNNIAPPSGWEEIS